MGWILKEYCQLVEKKLGVKTESGELKENLSNLLDIERSLVF